jgi:signal transduction histidine kinase/ActR/RegA family two-component response regulator
LVNKETPELFHLKFEIEERAEELSKELKQNIKGFDVFTAKAKIQEFEERTWIYVRKNNTAIYVNIIVSAIRDINNKITGFLGIAHDITERKEAEEELKRVSTRLALATFAGGVGVWDYDIIENKLIWDDKMYELYGLKSNPIEILYDSWLAAIHPDDAERVGKEIEMAIDDIKNFDTEFQIIWSDESIHNIRALATVQHNQTGKSIRMIGTNWDITEQKNNERILLTARKEAESANKAKSEFLANVSHEIRTPMNAIIGFAEILKDKISEDKLKDHIKTILSSGRTLLTLINDILDLSKIEADRLEVEYEAINYNSLINDIEQIFSPKIQSKNLSCEVITHPDVPPYIYMDEVRFHQILFNIVGNAIKFTNKGFIRIETKVIPTKSKNTVELIIEIEDTGIGIPNNQLDLIFDAFTQQSGQSNRQFEGTGLGLAITKRLIKKMNGTIAVKSSVGKGSTFTITFKKIEIAKVNDTSEKNNEIQEREIKFLPATIMVVDDIDFNIQVVESMLDFANFRFISANSGEKALELLEFEKPDIIFMDIRMYGISGISTTEIIKKNDQLKHIPIIAFTASALQNQMDLINTLFDGYVGKPISKKTLIQTLKEHLKYNLGDEIEIEKSTKFNDTEIDEECLKEIPEIIVLLENDFVDNWKEISGNLIIFEIEEFCNKLQELSNQFNCNILQAYVSQLHDSIQSFDVELIDSSVKEFENLIEIMKNHIKQ